MSQVLPPRTIHPYPNKVLWGDDILMIGRQVDVHLPVGLASSMGPWMAELWQKFTLRQSRLHIVPSASESLTIMLCRPATANLKLQSEDSYALCVDDQGICAVARDETSLRHAWMTLMQLLQAHDLSSDQALFALPHVVIHDRPALVFRGLHVCVFPETTLEFLHNLMHLTGMLKYSHIVLEFWGMLKLEALPELAWPMAYSKQQVQSLLDIASDYGVQVIPMYNAWGHAASSRIRWGRHVVLDQNPLLEPLFEPDGWTWCLSNPVSRTLIKNIIDELSQWAGPGDYFHIGCDEAYSHATCDRCRQRDRVGIWVEHLNDLSAHLQAMGRRAIIWGDTLLERAAWPTGYEANGVPHLPTHLAIDQLSKRILIADWHYDLFEGEVPTVAHFQQHGYDVVSSPWHELKNIQTLATAAQNQTALGMLATTWHRLPQHMTMLMAASNAAWSDQLHVMNLPQSSWSQMTGALGAMKRRLIPSEGDFTRAGWNRYEVSNQE